MDGDLDTSGLGLVENDGTCNDLEDPDDHLEVTSGGLRPLTREERKRFSSPYTHVTTSPSVYKYQDKEVVVPTGFLTDGSTGGPDYGRSWLFHDWLYSTHQFTSGQKCTRQQADEVMRQVLRHENLEVYMLFFCKLSLWNPFWAFTRAWAESGDRGPQFLQSSIEFLPPIYINRNDKIKKTDVDEASISPEL